ncbi:hypothetical protein Bca52824_035154 [Brassica carinata]|uniref:Uncharacterized protein n=1 Tax=Brassica carinata TaxID=52824 RepID=A0A8X7V1G4_BRACI|nr:hypothetical protein Bca52824_035154 [Brassica carinata]
MCPVPGTTAKKGDAVMSGATIRLQHMNDPEMAPQLADLEMIQIRILGITGSLYSEGAGRQVCGISEKRADNVWLAAEGVYLPVNETWHSEKYWIKAELSC